MNAVVYKTRRSSVGRYLQLKTFFFYHWSLRSHHRTLLQISNDASKVSKDDYFLVLYRSPSRPTTFANFSNNRVNMAVVSVISTQIRRFMLVSGPWTWLINKIITPTQAPSWKKRRRLQESEKKNMNSSRPRSNPALVLGTNESKIILNYSHNAKYFVSAQGDIFNIDTHADPYNQVSIVEKNNEAK